MRIVYLVGVYVDVKEQGKGRKPFSGKRHYLYGALYESLVLPPKTLIVHFVRRAPKTTYEFTYLRFAGFTKVPYLLHADAYVSLDADLIFSEAFPPYVEGLLKGEGVGGFVSTMGPRMELVLNTWDKYKPLRDVADFVRVKPLMPYRVCAGLFGLKRDVWAGVMQHAFQMFHRYYEAHPHLKRERDWDRAPAEECFITVALTPYYHKGQITFVAVGPGIKCCPELPAVPTSIFRYTLTHSASFLTYLKFLNQEITSRLGGGILEASVNDVLSLIRERQYIYADGELQG